MTPSLPSILPGVAPAPLLTLPHRRLLTLDDDYGAPLAEFTHYPSADVLHVRWLGHMTAAEVVRGVKHGGQWRNELHYSRVLNDKSEAGGDWSEALPWLQYEWLPLAVAAGIKAMAYVFSPDRENRMVSREFVEAVRPYMAIKVFDNTDQAWAWLHTHPM
jgi:hypothetical protein